MNAEHNTLLDRIGERTFNILGAAWFAYFLYVRMGTRQNYYSMLLFTLEAAVPAMILVAYLTRERAVVRARGFDAVVLPLLGAALPFAFSYAPFASYARVDVFVACLIPPTFLMVVGYLFLNRSFAIMAEARSLKTAGPYRFVRHPVYLCHLLVYAVVVVFRPSPLSLALYALFVWIQVRRSQAEDRALAEAHGPVYEDYRRRVHAFWPF